MKSARILEFEVCDFTFFHFQALSHNNILFRLFCTSADITDRSLHFLLVGSHSYRRCEDNSPAPIAFIFSLPFIFFSLESSIAKALGSPFPIFALTLPMEFTELGEVTYLSLSHCQLTAIPEYIGLALFSSPQHRLSISNLSIYPL